MTWSFTFIRGRLARRMTLTVILASTFITLFTSGYQIYSEFRRDVNQVHAIVKQIESSHLSTISSRLWTLDEKELKTTLQGILSLPSIQYLAIYEEGHKSYEMGKGLDKNVLETTYPIMHDSGANIEIIGELVVQASLDEAYAHLIDNAITIVASNAIKTFVVAGLILLIFYRLVARHLGKIAHFASSLSLDNLETSFEFNRKSRSHSQPDELEQVKIAFNQMQSNLLKATNEIRQREENIAVTLDSIDDGVVSTDIEGRIQRINPVAQKLTGYTSDEAIGKPVHVVFRTIDSLSREVIDSPLNEVVVNNQRVFHFENVLLVSKEFEEHPVSYSAAPIRRDRDSTPLGLVITIHDLTEKKRLKTEVDKTKRDLQAIMDHSSAVIYIKKSDGSYLFVNKAYEKLFHVTRDEMLEKNDYDIFPAEYADVFSQNDAKVFAEKQAFECQEKVAQDDGEHHYLSTKFPLYDEEGTVYAMCGISTDITELRQKENELRHAKKMDALGKLTGGIAHDYNNMLSIILGYSEFLVASTQDQPKLNKYAQQIQSTAERGAGLTKKLLSFSKFDQTEAEPTNVNDLLLHSRTMLEKTLTSRIELDMQLETPIWVAQLDQGDFEDALINLAINAMHAIDGNGQLLVKTQNAHLNAQDAKSLGLNPGDYVLLQIKDTGCGMSKEVQERIFDPFFTTKGEEGTGLGLSQLYGFMERSNGAIKVSSEADKGAEFSLYFPRVKEELPNTVLSTENAIAIDKGSEHILVVDDEPELLALTAEVLQLNGYQVSVANNGEEALRVLEKQHIDLMLSDVIMPQMNGYELASLVSERYPQVKVQLISGFADNINNSKVDFHLKQNMLYKPVSSIELLKKLRALFESPENKGA